MKPDSSRIQTKRPTGASASLRVSASGGNGGDSFKVKPPTEVKASFEKSPVKTEPSFETEPSLEKIPTSAESSLKLGPHGLDPLRRLLGDSSAKRLATYFAKAAHEFGLICMAKPVHAKNIADAFHIRGNLGISIRHVRMA